MSIKLQPSPRSHWSVVVLAVLFLAGSLLGATGLSRTLGEKAEAHVKFSNDRWVFRGRTISSSGNRYAKKDPLNIIFLGDGRYYYNKTIRNHVDDHANWGGAGPCAGQQRVVWQKRNTRDTTSDKDDFQLDNVKPWNCAGSRWHLRAWNDHEHNNYTDSHDRRFRWIVAGVHYDKLVWKVPCISCPPVPDHEIGKDWDVARRSFINKMAGHCSWPNWKRHGGARLTREEGQEFANSGRIGRISLKHTGGSSC